MADIRRRWKKWIEIFLVTAQIMMTTKARRKPYTPETIRRIARGRSVWGAKTENNNCFWGTNSRRAPRALDRCVSKEKWEGAAWTLIGHFVVSPCFVSINIFRDSFAGAWFFSVFELTDGLDGASDQKIQNARFPPWRARIAPSIDRALRSETYLLRPRKKRNGRAAALVMPMRGDLRIGP